MKQFTRHLICCLGAFYMTTAYAQPLGIIGAMDVEIEKIHAAMQGVETQEIANKTFYKGKIHNQDVLLVKSGVGKVQAAVTTDVLAREFKVGNIIFTGVAGAASPKVDVKDVVIANALVQHDVDLTEFGAPKGQLDGYDKRDFATDVELSEKLYAIAQDLLGKDHVHQGLVATGDQFIANKQIVAEIHQEFGALAVEMEGAAVAQVADLYDIPFAVLRTMSDKADGSAKLTYEEMKSVTAQQSSQILLTYLKQLSAQ